MRYLIPAAGMARRLGDALGGRPKCLIEIAGEPLIARLIRQIRANDAAADIHVVLGYRSADVLPHVEGCRIVLNPFFDVTSIVASLWLARASFDQALMLIHGDLVLSDPLFARLAAAPHPTLIGYDSSILKAHEINVRVARDKLVGFGEKIDEYHGIYGGVLKLADDASLRFREALEARVERGFNEPNGYYFFIVRKMLREQGIEFPVFDFAGERWQEIDHIADIASAQARFGPEHVAV